MGKSSFVHTKDVNEKREREKFLKIYDDDNDVNDQDDAI